MQIRIHENEDMNFVYLKTPIGNDEFVEKYLEGKLTRLRKEIKMLSEMKHLHECFTLLRSCAAACKVTHLMRTIPPKQLAKFLNGFDIALKKAMERILGHDLSGEQWLVCQLPAKYGGLGLRSGKLVFGAQHVMSLQKCAKEMANHAQDWKLEECAKKSSEAWLKDCIGSEFNMSEYLSEGTCSRSEECLTNSSNYTLSLAQRCEYSCYLSLLKSMSDNDRLRLISNSGPTQSWVTALPLGFKN